MSIERAFVKYQVYRGDDTPQFFDMFNVVGETETAIDIAASYEDIVLEVRVRQDPNSELLKRASLQDGTMSIVSTNKLSFDLTMDKPQGVYFYDVRLRIKDSERYQTWVSGPLIITDNISRK